MRNSRILREYVQSVLLAEDDAGGGYDMSGLGDSPYGISWGGPSMTQTFLQPFADVFSTAKAAASNISARTRTLAKITFESLATSVLPFLIADYNDIFKEEKLQLDKIQQKYADVFARTNNAFKNDDIKLVAFMLNPALTIAAAAATATPMLAIGLYDVLAGTDPYLKNYLVKAKKFAEKKISAVTNKKYSKGSSGYGGYDTGMYGEAKLHEADDKGKEELIAMLTDPKFLIALNNSPTAKAIKQEATQIINATVKKLMDRFKQVQAARTVDDLVRLFPKIDRSKVAEFQKLPQQEKTGVEQQIATQVKAAAKKLYSEVIKAQLASAKAANLPNNHPLVAGYTKVLSMLQSS